MFYLPPKMAVLIAVLTTKCRIGGSAISMHVQAFFFMSVGSRVILFFMTPFDSNNFFTNKVHTSVRQF